jgi:hypothetical protein
MSTQAVAVPWQQSAVGYSPSGGCLMLVLQGGPGSQRAAPCTPLHNATHDLSSADWFGGMAGVYWRVCCPQLGLTNRCAAVRSAQQCWLTLNVAAHHPAIVHPHCKWPPPRGAHMLVHDQRTCDLYAVALRASTHGTPVQTAVLRPTASVCSNSGCSDVASALALLPLQLLALPAVRLPVHAGRWRCSTGAHCTPHTSSSRPPPPRTARTAVASPLLQLRLLQAPFAGQRWHRWCCCCCCWRRPQLRCCQGRQPGHCCCCCMQHQDWCWCPMPRYCRQRRGWWERPPTQRYGVQ